MLLATAMRSVVLALSSFSIAVGLFGGCTIDQGTPTSSSSGTSGGVDAPPPISCLQILQCIVACPDGDNACPNACADRGTPEAQTDLLALVDCVNAQQCADATCLTDKCAMPIGVCVSSSGTMTGGPPLDGAPPSGSVPPDLVGAWSGARDGMTERLSFNSDGSGEWTSSIVTEYSGCLSFHRKIRQGTMVVGDGLITLYATTIVNQTQDCIPPTIDSAGAPEKVELQWHRSDSGDPNTIFLIDSECAAKYPGTENCNTLGCPIALYCTSRLMRE